MKAPYHLLLPIIIINLSSCYSTVSDKTGLEGKRQPNFTLLLPDSSTYYSPIDSLSKQPTVVLYYSPKCPYCRAQMNNIIDNIENLKEIKFFLVTNYTFAEMIEFNKEYQLYKYPNLINGLDINNLLANYYEIQGVPYVAVYGKDKKLNKVFEGKVYSSYIKKAAFSNND